MCFLEVTHQILCPGFIKTCSRSGSDGTHHGKPGRYPGRRQTGLLNILVYLSRPGVLATHTPIQKVSVEPRTLLSQPTPGGLSDTTVCGPHFEKQGLRAMVLQLQQAASLRGRFASIRAAGPHP